MSQQDIEAGGAFVDAVNRGEGLVRRHGDHWEAGAAIGAGGPSG